MLVMAKNKPPRQGSRHRPRKMISFRPELYDLLAELAKRNKRPLSWEAEIIVEAALSEAGLWPPPGDATK